jgi:hypothetical protein
MGLLHDEEENQSSQVACTSKHDSSATWVKHRIRVFVETDLSQMVQSWDSVKRSKPVIAVVHLLDSQL